VRRTRYQEIADELRTRLGSGELGAGRLLPSESELSADYAASRVTVRRALEVLRDEGLVDSRQGFGWFVAADPVRQALGRLGTIESQLASEGVHSERRVLDFRFVAAPARVRTLLDSDTVLRVRRLNLADGEPFALVTVWCPERYGAELSRADVERSPFYELIGVELGGAVQSIGAAAATAHDALDGRPEPDVLIGGLGVGFSLAHAAADHRWGRITVVERERAIIDWHRDGPLAALSARALADPRTEIVERDLVEYVNEISDTFDALCLDIDNGPGWTVTEGNAGLYGKSGLASCARALRPGGVLAVWSAQPSPEFEGTLRNAGFRQVRTEVIPVARGVPDVVHLAVSPG